MKSAVLLLIFSRPSTTSVVMEAIRKARPPALYVAADGPRPGRPDEAARCEEARRIATAVDWPCEVHTLFRTANLGCKRGVCEAIDWFFEHVEQGIILEDDVVPVPSFFTYCDELLERYRDDPRVGLIAGSNPVSRRLALPASYDFSRYIHIWGWASWRRVWQSFDLAMADWPQQRARRDIYPARWGGVSYWRAHYDRVYANTTDEWDYQFFYHCWKNHLLGAIAAENMVENIGFGAAATHTDYQTPHQLVESPPTDLVFPLTHPPRVAPNEALDATLSRQCYRETVLSALFRGPYLFLLRFRLVRAVKPRAKLLLRRLRLI